MIITLSVIEVKGQNFLLYAGTQIPLQYTIGFENKFTKHLSANIHGGIITKPYDKAILNIIEALGTEEVYIKMIEHAFELGYIGEIGIRYHFNKNYSGIYTQYVSLTAADTPTELIEGYYNIDIDKYPLIHPKIISKQDNELRIKSDLLQIGIIFGRRFSMPNPNLEIRAEISLSKNLSSASKISSSKRYVEGLNNMIDSELKGIYRNYAYLPTINVYLVYKPYLKK